MVPVSNGFLILLTVVLVVLLIFIIRKIIKYLTELTEVSREPPKSKTSVPSNYIDDKPVTNRRMTHLKTVYIPYPISQNIEEIVTSVSDSEYELGYGFDTMYTEKVDNGLVLFIRFQLL